MFVEEKLESGDDFKYEAENYDFPMTTKQEKPLQFYAVSEIQETDNGYTVVHNPVEDDGFDMVDQGSGTATSLTDF